MLHTVAPTGRARAPARRCKKYCRGPTQLRPARVHGKAGHQEVAARGTSQGGLAARYAAALFDLADEQKQLDSVAGDLVALRGMMAESGDLRRLIGSPVLSRGDQGRAMAALLDAAGTSDLVRRFIGLVAQNRRLFVLPAIIDAYLAQLARRRGEITAQVTSARPLDERQRQAVAEAVQRAVGGKVAVDAKVDAGLIGGLVVKVGSRMVDSSLRSKLQRLQLTMKGVG
jgi:F-type H+-transporting ATPase subunit delta